MLRYIKHTLDTIDGVSIYPIIAFIIFFVFFCGLIYWVFTTKSSYIKYVENIPFDKDYKLNKDGK